MSLLPHLKYQTPFLFIKGFAYFDFNSSMGWHLEAFLLFYSRWHYSKSFWFLLPVPPLGCIWSTCSTLYLFRKRGCWHPHCCLTTKVTSDLSSSGVVGVAGPPPQGLWGSQALLQGRRVVGAFKIF